MEDYFNVLLGKLEELGLEITDCRGKAYHGTSNIEEEVVTSHYR